MGLFVLLLIKVNIQQKINNGKIMQFEDLKILFDKFIINVLNKKPSQGKVLKGLSPDELFNSEFKEKYTPWS